MNHSGMTDFEVFQKLASLILGRKIMSWLQLGKLARTGDDKAKRVIQRLSSQLGVQLVTAGENRVLTVTEAGREFYELLTRLSSLADQESPAEKVTVLADPLVVQILLPEPLSAYFALWGSAASVTLPAVNGVESLRKEILEGRGDFAISFAESDESVSADEALGPKLPWVLLVPKKDHRFSGHHGPVSAEQLRGTDRVFLPGMAAKNEELEAFLAPSHCGRVECEVVPAMVDAGLGLGIIPDLFGNQETNGVCKLAIENVTPSQLRLVLSRKGMAGLSEPAEALVQSIRNACESRFASPVNGEAVVPERAAHSLFQESTPQLAETVHDR